VDRRAQLQKRIEGFARARKCAQRAHLSEELADTFIYLTKLGDHFGIDLVEAALAKMDKNELKYPAAKNQGRIFKARR
jgi:hypothetical protein